MDIADSIERDITRDDCNGKRKQFFDCVISKKNELTKSLTSEDWSSYIDRVDNLNFKCWEEKGLRKCENFFTLFDIKY
jgi:hypothetical protein